MRKGGGGRFKNELFSGIQNGKKQFAGKKMRGWVSLDKAANHKEHSFWKKVILTLFFRQKAAFETKAAFCNENRRDCHSPQKTFFSTGRMCEKNIIKMTLHFTRSFYAHFAEYFLCFKLSDRIFDPTR
jgi:hypothetical protein